MLRRQGLLQGLFLQHKEHFRSRQRFALKYTCVVLLISLSKYYRVRIMSRYLGCRGPIPFLCKFEPDFVSNCHKLCRTDAESMLRYPPFFFSFFFQFPGQPWPRKRSGPIRHRIWVNSGLGVFRV